MARFTGSYSGCMATRARKRGSQLATSARVCKTKVFGDKPRKASRKGSKGSKGSGKSCLKVCVKQA